MEDRLLTAAYHRGTWSSWHLIILRQPFAELRLNTIAHITEGLQALLVAAAGSCRVGEAPVNPRRWPGKDRAGFGGVVTDRDDIIKRIIDEFVEVFGAMAADVDAALAHGCGRQRVDDRRLAAGAEDFEAVVGYVAQQPLSHLRAGRVSGAED